MRLTIRILCIAPRAYASHRIPFYTDSGYSYECAHVPLSGHGSTVTHVYCSRIVIFRRAGVETCVETCVCSQASMQSQPGHSSHAKDRNGLRPSTTLPPYTCPNYVINVDTSFQLGLPWILCTSCSCHFLVIYCQHPSWNPTLSTCSSFQPFLCGEWWLSTHVRW